ncbi:hypothetical protein FKW77_006519 [Venturia effusa]|uniref:Uncharacterized protein n=1 Tax=Venturia effusa TaxID=50376 RepID=A0A517LKD6_9PEZI|nr:hypothetical protein FKW77_006519 [Venturia effusa]
METEYDPFNENMPIKAESDITRDTFSERPHLVDEEKEQAEKREAQRIRFGLPKSKQSPTASTRQPEGTSENRQVGIKQEPDREDSLPRTSEARTESIPRLPTKLQPFEMRNRYSHLRYQTSDEQIRPSPDGFKSKSEEWRERGQRDRRGRDEEAERLRSRGTAHTQQRTQRNAAGPSQRPPRESQPPPEKPAITAMRKKYPKLPRLKYEESIRSCPDGARPVEKEWRSRCLHCGKQRTRTHCDARKCDDVCFQCQTDKHTGEMCPGIEGQTDGYHERKIWTFWARFSFDEFCIEDDDDDCEVVDAPPSPKNQTKRKEEQRTEKQRKFSLTKEESELLPLIRKHFDTFKKIAEHGEKYPEFMDEIDEFVDLDKSNHKLQQELVKAMRAGEMPSTGPSRKRTREEEEEEQMQADIAKIILKRSLNRLEKRTKTERD